MHKQNFMAHNILFGARTKQVGRRDSFEVRA